VVSFHGVSSLWFRLLLKVFAIGMVSECGIACRFKSVGLGLFRIASEIPFGFFCRLSELLARNLGLASMEVN
jgi:hypothetical protein